MSDSDPDHLSYHLTGPIENLGKSLNKINKSYN